jgi:hypothetical protein
LQRVHALGARRRLVGERIEIEGPRPVPGFLMEQLRARKAEIRSFLERCNQASFFDLPFPLGYGGLPRAQVEAAEAINNKLGIKDPVQRKYNVLSWVRGYYQDRGENYSEHYQAIKAEQLRLSEILRGGQS